LAQRLDPATRDALVERVRFYRDLGLTEFTGGRWMRRGWRRGPRGGVDRAERAGGFGAGFSTFTNTHASNLVEEAIPTVSRSPHRPQLVLPLDLPIRLRL